MTPRVNAAYEDEEVLNQYLLFHFGGPGDQFPYALGAVDGLHFPRRCVEQGVDLERLPSSARGLDLGCAVGGATFELARHCTEVIGVDASRAFIAAAQRLQREGRHPVERAEEGALTTRLTVTRDPEIEAGRIRFACGDAQALPADLGDFDVVLACNLVCRLPDPMKLLTRLPALVRPGGQLLLTTPFTWLEAYTPRDRWLVQGGRTSFEGLQRALVSSFRLVRQFDLPFLIREHARKYQYGVALATRWVRGGS